MSEIIDENSCIKVVYSEIEIGLLPKYMGDEEQAITKLMDHWKGKYNHELKGVLLDYKHVKFATDLGRIIDDQPFIYWKIGADFHLFNVSVGQHIKAKINRIGHRYVGSLVGNYVDSTIIISEDIENEEELSPYLKIDQEIIFRVNDFDSNHCFIDGVIDEECLDQMKRYIQLNQFDASFTNGSFFT